MNTAKIAPLDEVLDQVLDQAPEPAAETAWPARLPDGLQPEHVAQHLDELQARIVSGLRATAELERQHGRWEQSAQMLAACLALAGDDPDLLRKHGYAATLAGEESAALASYDRLLALGHDSPELHHDRGLVLYAMGDLEGAAAALEQAVASATDVFSPQQLATIQNDLGVIRQRIGDLDGSRDAFECALSSDASCTEARRNLVELQTTAGRS
jgi:tetratricopeptide (TPR) repeat protein